MNYYEGGNVEKDGIHKKNVHHYWKIFVNSTRRKSEKMRNNKEHTTH